MRIIVAVFLTTFALIVNAIPERVDIPFEMVCTFTGTISVIQKTYKSDRITYPLLNNKWWTAVSNTSKFTVDDVTVTDLFVRSFDYKDEGTKSVFHIAVEHKGESHQIGISDNNPNQTGKISFFSAEGLILTAECILN